MNDLITIKGLASTSIVTTAEARAKRDALLTTTRAITAVASSTEAEVAAAALKEINTLTQAVEHCRKTVKAPVLDLGRQIDARAKELADELELEKVRVAKVLGAWQSEQARLAAEARRKAEEEERRIREEAARIEREAAEKARAEAEELRRKKERARSVAKQEEYAAQRKLAEERAERERLARLAATNQAMAGVQDAVPPTPERVAGLSKREEIMFEVENVHELYAAHPMLVRLTPNHAALKEALKGLAPGQHLPGVRHWKEAKAVVSKTFAGVLETPFA